MSLLSTNHRRQLRRPYRSFDADADTDAARNGFIALTSNVYARTPADFTLQLSGDKFTPALHIVMDGRDLPTRFISPQQLLPPCPQTSSANPGVRQVMARSNDGQIYSNTITLNVTPPPLPNYNYVGLIGKPRLQRHGGAPG